jgi:uncharacterized membrane protein
MSIFALRWDSFALTKMQQLIVDGDARPAGGSQATRVVVGVGWNLPGGSGVKAAQWHGATIAQLPDAGAGGNTQAVAISLDGSVIVGSDGAGSAIRWTGGGAAGGPLSPGAGYTSAAFSGQNRIVSSDGRYIVGTSEVVASPSNLSQATIWDNGAASLLPYPALGGLNPATNASAFGCDAAGDIVIGNALSPAGTPFLTATTVACLWTGGAGRPLAPVIGEAPAASGGSLFCLADGSIVYGFTQVGGVQRYVYWDSLATTSSIVWPPGGEPATTFYGVANVLAYLPGGNSASALACADDLVGGSPVAVGYATDASGNQWATKWTGTAATNLGGLPSGSASQANGVSADGSIVVGTAWDAAGVQWPVYWDAGLVIHKLPTAADAADTFQGEALGISPDGTLIWGDGDAPAAPPAAAVLNPPMVFLSWSDDRGHAFGSPVGQSLGAGGEYLKSVQWQRLGMARDRVFTLEWSSPVQTVLQGAWIVTEPALS